MVKNDDERSVSSEAKGPLKSFQALMGEGEKFSRDKLYTKAIQCYTEALELLPQDEDKLTPKDTNDRLNGLVARSACYLKIGKNDLALQDAEASLKSNKEFTKGLYQKAEALYAMGEFELALMFYHRGKKLRSDLREFQLGINKSQEAIDNSVGDPNRVKLEASGDLSIFYKNEEDESKKKKKQPMGYVRASQKKDTTMQRKAHQPITNPKTTKQLLGDLYEDRAFLDKIITNTTVTKQNTKSGDAIYQLASDGIDYLDSRTDFWRQQEPLYARSKFSKKSESDDEAYKHIRRELEAIDEQQNMDQFVDARRRAHRLLDFCERLDERKFNEKQSVLSDVYSRLGNAYLELGDYNKSLEFHNRDLKIAEAHEYTERKSRALDNLGRVYARSGQFPQAIQVWERKIPLASSPLEKAWLFHEIGQCHFGLGDYERAQRYGERSYAAAVEVNDPIWQLNAKVLVAHSQTKLRQYREAEQTFEEALVLAKDQRDVAAEKAIERALKDVRDQIAKGAADSPPDRTEINYEIKVKSEDGILFDNDDDKGDVRVLVFGDNGSSGPIDLRANENDAKRYDGSSGTIKKKAFDAGKMTKIALTCSNVEAWPLEYIEVTDTKRKSKIKFLLPQPLDSTSTIADLYPEGSIVQFSDSIQQTKPRGKPRPTPTKEKSSKTPELKAALKEADTTPRRIPYTVSVQTGSMMNAGTDANVFISIFGDKNKIVKHPLKKPDSGKNPFEKGHKDDFTFEHDNVGKVKTIAIEHDDSGVASGWYLESVEVKANNETTTFPVQRWLDKDEGDKQIRLELEPNKKPASKASPEPVQDGLVEYEVTVKTGDKRTGGTDANVTLSIFGDKSKIEQSQLKQSIDKSRNLFESGATNCFQVRGPDVGKVKSIRIGHDGKGVGSGWYLDSVEVRHVPQNVTYKFPVDRWLDDDEGDKRTTLDLEPNKKPGQLTDTAPKQPAKTPYKVTVHTGSVNNAGTDANVYISLFGDKNKIVKHQLKKPDSGKNPFEKGNTDEFSFEDEDIGKLKTITMEHDGAGMASGWYLESVDVKVNNETSKFPVGRWLDKNEDDKRTSLELEPNKKPASKASPEPVQDGLVEYEVTVKTGDKRGAGTDANVTLSIFGDKSKIEQSQLKQSIEKSRNLFEANATNRFQVRGPDVGKVKSVRIGHDGKGLGSGWYLDSVEVRHVPQNVTYKFPVDRWLDDGEGDKRTTLDLEPDKKPGQLTDNTPKPPAKTPYKVSVQTGSVNNAGTDANVFISLFGDKNKIVKHQLKKPDSGKDPFEKGHKDEFSFEDEDIGKLKTITIEHDGKGLASGWYLDSIEVKANNQTTMFPVGRWLDTEEDDKRTSLELEPNKKPASKATVVEEKKKERTPTPTSTHEQKDLDFYAKQVAKDDLSDNDDTKNDGNVEYEVTVKTGSKRGAGTDANVYLSIFGDKNKIEKSHLKQSIDKSKDLFETGVTNRFQIRGPDVGKVKTVRVSHDGKGFGAGWYLDSIEVRHVPQNVTYKFPVDRWLDENEDDKRISLDLEPDKKPGQLTASTTPTKQAPSDPNKRPYIVTVQTGKELGSGTDATVYISLFGEKSKIQRYALKKPKSGKNPFEKGQKDEFVFDEDDVGKLKTITIEHDGTGTGSGWFCDSVEVKVNNETTMFPVGRWLDINEGDKRIRLDLEPNKKPAAVIATSTYSATPVEYDVLIKTGSKRGAGTDAQVYLSIFGDKHKIERYHLDQNSDPSHNFFESGGVDRFRISAPDVGKIQTVRIEHDGTGIGAGWYVDSIEVRPSSQNNTYKFPVDRWLDSGEGDKRISLDLEPDKKPGQLPAK